MTAVPTVAAVVTSPVRFYAALAGLFLVAALALGGFTYVNHLRHALTAAQVVEESQKGKATVATEQSAAQVAAAIIADRGTQRDQLSITLHEDHAHALQSAPGATAQVDPALNAAGRRGLCEYAAYSADPGCAGLRGGDPAQLPQAGPGDPPA